MASTAIVPATGKNQINRRRVAIVALAVIALCVAGPVSAANNKPTTGTKIGLFAPPATFPANTPFYIEHGTAALPPFSPPEATIGMAMSAGTHFDLSVDGVAQSGSVDIDNQPGVWLKRDLYNFPEGLPAGTHTFVGDFYFEGTIYFTVTATITFT
jgi:hypothetical protein